MEYFIKKVKVIRSRGSTSIGRVCWAVFIKRTEGTYLLSTSLSYENAKEDLAFVRERGLLGYAENPVVGGFVEFRNYNSRYQVL